MKTDLLVMLCGGAITIASLSCNTGHLGATGDPGSGDPGSGDPGSGDPGSGDPGSGDPGSDPGSGDPGNGDPGNGDPGSGANGDADPVLGTIHTELAGRTLAGYPHFSPVRSFHASQPVRLGVDPTRFPQIAGKTCDVYVVEAKTVSQWETDGTLTDARGRAQTVVFSGDDIQANIVDIVVPNELAGMRGADIGASYDVVLDCDQNGQVGVGDYADGLSGRAGFYVVPEITSPGPHGVASVAHSAGTWLDQITYYPADISSMRFPHERQRAEPRRDSRRAIRRWLGIRLVAWADRARRYTGHSGPVKPTDPGCARPKIPTSGQ